MKQSTQNYLKTIFSLAYPDVKSQVKPGDISKKLDVTPAAVTDMLKKLEFDKYVVSEPYVGVSLTDKGLAIGCNMVRHHRLWEAFLSQVIGLPWDKVHDEAERLEHACSDDLINRIEVYMGFPKHDPHGNPIPDKDGTIPEPLNDKPLSELKVGDSGNISRVVDFDDDFLNYLRQQGVQLGKRIEVTEVLGFDNSVVCSVDGNSVTIGKKASEQIFLVV